MVLTHDFKFDCHATVLHLPSNAFCTLAAIHANHSCCRIAGMLQLVYKKLTNSPLQFNSTSSVRMYWCTLLHFLLWRKKYYLVCHLWKSSLLEFQYHLGYAFWSFVFSRVAIAFLQSHHCWKPWLISHWEARGWERRWELVYWHFSSMSLSSSSLSWDCRTVSSL